MMLARARLGLVALAWVSMLTTHAPAHGQGTAPRSPEEERTTFRLADPRLTIELVASEPEVVSPVAIAWDEDRRMFVAEMIDYPDGPTAGRIRMLADRNNDGYYETSTIFAAGLPFPTSVLPWNGGLFVTAAPDILYFRDRDGDGRADERKVILTGFTEGNQQLRVNGLTMGLDNWVYGANGRSDGLIRRPADPPEKGVLLRHHDFRFRPTTGEFEAIAGFSQFGLPRDDWGNRFPSWNTVPIRHVVIEERILSRNPYLAESSSVAEILDPTDGNRVFAISPPQVTFNRESVTTFNASCGPTIYRGNLLGAAYNGNAFVCESLLNLVHRLELQPVGLTFSAHRVEPGQEFLASTDPAFRPVNLTTGPDGGLYVIDFYREMVEHPQFVPKDVRSSVNFRRWSDRGRIWRIRPTEKRTDPDAIIMTRLSRAQPAELVKLLGHPSGWWRDVAQRLLVERHGSTSIALIAEATCRAKTALARLHALWTLEGLGALTSSHIAQAASDPDPGVREAAARLAHGRPDLTDILVKLSGDRSVRVRFQAVIGLGDIPDDRATAALAKVAVVDGGDEWMRLAILSGLRDTAWPFLEAVLAARPDWLSSPTPAAAAILSQTGSLLGGRHRPNELAGLADYLAPEQRTTHNRGRIALLDGLVEGLARAGQSPPMLLSKSPARSNALASNVDALLEKAKVGIESNSEPSEMRATALRVLARFRPEAVAELIPRLLSPTEPAVLQSAAARAIADVGSPALITRVLDHWTTLTITTRRDVLAAAAGSAFSAKPLVDALETGVIAPSELDAAARVALTRIPDAAQRQRAADIITKAAPPERATVVLANQSALSMPADARRGAELFARNCQTCHQRRGQGHKVGPDLSSVASRPASALLHDILDPNRDLSADFTNFLVVTKQGRVLSGLLVEETSTSLRLRRSEGVEDKILRSEIAELRSTGRSLMPEGLEQVLGTKGLADILAFLRQP